MKQKRTIPSLLLSGLMVVAWPVGGASQGHTSLALTVQPEAFVQAPSSIVWAVENGPTLLLPFNIKVRLNRGTDADLSLSSADQTVSLSSAAGDSLQPSLEVDGVSGASALSNAPVVLRRFSQSGVFSHSAVVRLSAPPQPGSYLVPVVVRLSSDDSLAAFSVPITIRVKVP